MSATFEIKITAIRTKTVGTMENVIKNVDFTVTGTEQGETFTLPQNMSFEDPKTELFVPLEELTESEVIAWIESNFQNMDSVKGHIQIVLNRELVKHGLNTTPLPWAPPEPTPSPAPGVTGESNEPTPTP